ncbi:MAG: class I SAM-dependent methyltransferase [Acidobacteriota bacterium]
MVQFTEQIASNYRETRYMPPKVGRNLVFAGMDLKGAGNRRPRVVADVGCGVGRFLPALDDFAGVYSVCAYDLSVDMLNKASNAVADRTAVHLIQRDCSLPRAMEPEAFDLVLLHWILNTTPAWYEIVGNCTKALRPGGVLLWFEERGTLYEAVDGNAAETALDGNGAPIEFWLEFYEGLGKWGERESLRRREGVSMGAETSLVAIADRGLKVSQLAGAKFSWTSFVTMEWLVVKVLAPRCFTNLSAIPEPVYDRALRRLSKWLRDHPSVARMPIRLDYKAAPVVAVKA